MKLRLTEPVRLYLYPVVVATVALLVAYGVVGTAQAPLWLAAGVAVLGVGGVEGARANVVSPATAAEVASTVASDVLHDYEPFPADEDVAQAVRYANRSLYRSNVPGSSPVID